MLWTQPASSVQMSELRGDEMPSYSDSEMRAIMGRALQIDSGRSERFTPEQLRTIAAELGISTQALEVAMYEADSNGVAAQQRMPVPAGRNGWAKGIAIAVGVLVVAALGFGFMRMTVGGADVARVGAGPQPYAQAAPTKVTTKTAPARAIKTSPPATTEPVAPVDQPVPKAPATKKVTPPQ